MSNTKQISVWECKTCGNEIPADQDECPCWATINENVWYCSRCNKELPDSNDCTLCFRNKGKSAYDIFFEVRSAMEKYAGLSESERRGLINHSWAKASDKRRAKFERIAAEENAKIKEDPYKKAYAVAMTFWGFPRLQKKGVIYLDEPKTVSEKTRFGLDNWLEMPMDIKRYLVKLSKKADRSVEDFYCTASWFADEDDQEEPMDERLSRLTDQFNGLSATDKRYWTRMYSEFTNRLTKDTPRIPTSTSQTSRLRELAIFEFGSLGAECLGF